MNSVSFHIFLSSAFGKKKLTSTVYILAKGGRPCQRRRRTKCSEEQLDRLEESFKIETYPGIPMREDLARELNVGRTEFR